MLQQARFTSPDPYPGSAQPGAPQTWNRYAYALNDPVNFNDPSGMWQEYEGDPLVCDWEPVGSPEHPGLLPWCRWAVRIYAERDIPRGGHKVGDDPCDRSNAANRRILDFITAHLADAETLAGTLGVATGWVVAVSAAETGWGQSNIAVSANNFFGLHAPGPGHEYPGQTGVYVTSQGVRVAAFPQGTGFYLSGSAFVGLVGPYVRGETNVNHFVAQLHQHGYGTTNPDYEAQLKAVIDSVARRLDCPK